MNKTIRYNEVDDTIDQLSAEAHETVNKVADASHQANSAFTQKATQAKQAEQKLLKDCRHYLDKNPLTSLGVAVGVGFLLSRVLSCR
jgi:ElaB/YqjD/DUF883 family membrane-anchored ribosome-binding protein